MKTVTVITNEDAEIVLVATSLEAAEKELNTMYERVEVSQYPTHCEISAIDSGFESLFFADDFDLVS